MTKHPADQIQTFAIDLPEGMACDPVTKELAEEYVNAAGGDAVYAVLLAAQDSLLLRKASSRGMFQGRKLIVDDLQ